MTSASILDYELHDGSLVGDSRKKRDDIRARAERILATEIEYIFSRFFNESDELPTSEEPDGIRRLAAEEEVTFFRAMNFAKYEVDRLRHKLSAEEPSEQLMDRIEALLRRAIAIRNQLVHVFVKLGISIARQLASSRYPIDELTSEANVTLMRAVDRFDCDRGFRFSTYATHAVRRNLVRYLTRRRKEQLLAMSTENLESVSERRKWTWSYERQIAAAATKLEKMMTRLDPRDGFILRSRVGLDGSCSGQSLQRIADELGVSRERVRQLECRATDRLRAMAKEANFEPFDA